MVSDRCEWQIWKWRIMIKVGGHWATMPVHDCTNNSEDQQDCSYGELSVMENAQVDVARKMDHKWQASLFSTSFIVRSLLIVCWVLFAIPNGQTYLWVTTILCCQISPRRYCMDTLISSTYVLYLLIRPQYILIHCSDLTKMTKSA